MKHLVYERLVYIDPQGVKYDLHAPPHRAVLSEEGLGMPPIEYVTERGPMQHGVTVKDFFLQPRPIQIIVAQNFCGRDQYWNGRAGLIDAIRPNKSDDALQVGAGVLRKYYANGRRRQFDVLTDGGPGFVPTEPGWRSWQFVEALRFTAHNPVAYDPATKSTSFNIGAGAGDQLEFPITFPIQFSASGETRSVTYEGNWLEYPTFIITGPIESPTIHNQTTDESITLATNIPAGRVATIKLTYGYKTVTLDDGTNLQSYISSDSDLVTFHLAPAPVAVGGANVLRMEGTGTSVDTAAEMLWYNRYMGV